MYSNVPFLDSEETVRIMAGEPIVGGIPDTGSPSSDESPGTNDSRKDRTRHNRQRCFWMTRAVKQNRLNYKELHEYLEANDVDDDSLAYLMDFRYAINSCCRHALFREHLANGAKEFIGAHTCKNKLCAVCNAKRAKDLRRKYRLFFDKNPDLLHCFDFFHLTLTVPHNESGGFRGKRWYADELMREFNFMRKKQAWKDLVYAGEFGVEVTKNENGLHIHIHSLLLVHKGPQNRNRLHRFILKSWNRQTAGNSNRRMFSPEEKAALLRSNKLLTPSDIGQLDPSGSTFIGLESLYIRSKEPKRGFHFCERSGFYKRYVKPSDGADIFLSGIMECIKYHFQPLALRDDGGLNFGLICEILPTIKGKPLYRKFGAFHSGTKNAHPDSKLLNINSKPEDFAKEAKEILEETGEAEITNPETGEPALREEYIYYLVNLDKVYVDPEDDYQIKISPNVRRRYLHAAFTTLDALLEMQLWGMLKPSA